MPAIGGFEECVEIFAQFGILVCAGSPGNDRFAMSPPRAKINNPLSMNSNDPVFFASGIKTLRHKRRSKSSFLSVAMACAGFKSFGQASGQFMIVWHRYRRKESPIASSRSPVASSRESTIQRYAASNAAGPQVAITVPPIARAAGGTACAENARRWSVDVLLIGT